MRRLVLILVACLGSTATSWPAGASATERKPPARWRQAGRGMGAAFHRFSLRHGLTVGTGLVVVGVATSTVLYQLGMDHAGTFAALVPPGVGVKMNTVALGTRLHDAYRRAVGTRVARLGTMMREETDATAVKIWSLGVKILGAGQVAWFEGQGHDAVQSLGAITALSGGALVTIGAGLHAAPRLMARLRPAAE